MNNVQAYQIYYTSCRIGLSGHSGFQIRAETNGILPADRSEILKFLAYAPSEILSFIATSNNDITNYPKSFRFLKLQSGHMALIHSVYVGLDYASNRSGNFFTHALIYDGPAEAGWPIDAYAWPGWVQGLADGQGDVSPEPLPTVAMSEAFAGEALGLEPLQKFLKEDEERRQQLRQMIMAVLRRTSDSRNIVIRAKAESDGARWIACLQKAFPPQCQGALSFSTHHHDPRQSFAVNAVCGKTNFHLDVRERDYQFYIFDFVDGFNSAIAIEDGEYADEIAKWMVKFPQELLKFHIFSKKFINIQIGPDLTQLLRLFRLNNEDNIKFSPVDIAELLEFVRYQIIPKYYSDVINCFGDVQRHLESNTPVDCWEKIIRFLADAAKTIGDPKRGQAACQAWMSMFDLFALDERQSVDRVMALKNELEAKFKGEMCLQAKPFLSKDHMKGLCDAVGRATIQALERIMAETVWACQQTGETPHESPAVRSLIEAFATKRPQDCGSLQWALAPFSSSVKGLAAVLKQVAVGLKDFSASDETEGSKRLTALRRQTGEGLDTFLASKGEGFRFQLLGQLADDDDLADVIYGEWSRNMLKINDKVAAQDVYEGRLLPNASPSLKTLIYDLMNMQLLDQLDDLKAEPIINNLLKPKNFACLSDSNKLKILELASQNVKLDPQDINSKHLAEQINDFYDDYKLQHNNNKIQLRLKIDKFQDSDDYYDQLFRLLKKIDCNTYNDFLDCNLNYFIKKFKGAAKQLNFIVNMGANKYEIFFEKYLNYLKSRMREHFDDIDLSIVLLWIIIKKYPNHKDYKNIAYMIKPVFKIFNNILMMPKQIFKENKYKLDILAKKNPKYSIEIQEYSNYLSKNKLTFTAPVLRLITKILKK